MSQITAQNLLLLINSLISSLINQPLAGLLYVCFPHWGAPKLCNSDDACMRDPHREIMLSGKTIHTRVKSISFFA